MNKAVVIFGLFLLFYSEIVSAEPTEIQSNLEEDWVHQNTGLVFPAQVNGFDREKIQDLSQNQLDVLVSYKDKNRPTVLTLYIYRAAIDDVPLWFETAKQSLLFGKVGQMGAKISEEKVFTPVGQALPAGMLAVFSLEGTAYRSTGLAMVPINGWLLKVRYTSEKLDAKQLVENIQSVAASIKVDGTLEQKPAAQIVKKCTKKLKLKSKAKRFRPTLVDALIGGVASSAEGEERNTETEKRNAAVYCRDPGNYGQWTVFRANEGKDGYVLPLGDSGRLLSVYRNSLSGLISGDRRKRYTPVHMELGVNKIYSDLNVLPNPETLLAAIDERALISSSTTWPEEGSTITIDSGLADDE